jgi:2-dehydropantoate 2-reductase
MRVVVYGAGGIGGVIGAQLYRAGHRVELIARGQHLAAIQQRGLDLELPEESCRLALTAVSDPAELDWSDEPAVVILAVKGQDTEGALAAIGAAAPATTAVVCAQNGVENERRALRRFGATYAMCVMCPTSHLEPGVVQAHSSPVTGLLDLGCFPSGVDQTAQTLAAALGGAGFDANAVPDIMRWKYTKLLKNLSNAIEALCGPSGRGSDIERRARREGVEVLEKAGIDFASDAEDAQRRGQLLRVQPTWRGGHAGGSSWQSLARGTGSIETDYLNGEIALLGRLHGLATPVNEALTVLARQAALERRAPGSISPEELAMLIDGG